MKRAAEREATTAFTESRGVVFLRGEEIDAEYLLSAFCGFRLFIGINKSGISQRK